MSRESNAEAMSEQIKLNRGLVEEFFSGFKPLDQQAVEVLSENEKQLLQDELVYRISHINSPQQIKLIESDPVCLKFLGTREQFKDNLAGRDTIILNLLSQRLIQYINLLKVVTEIHE